MRKFTKESTTYFVKGPVCRWNVQKMRTESSEFVRKTTEVSSQTVGESKWPWRAQTTVVEYVSSKIDCGDSEDTSENNSKRIINCIQLRKLQAQYQKSLLSMIKSRKEEEDSGMMSTVDICQKILCWLRDVKRLTGYILKVSTILFPMQECRDAGMKSLDLIWVYTDKSVDPTRKKIRPRLCAREYKTKKQGEIQRALPVFSIVLCSATSRSGEGAYLNHDVGEVVEQRETIEVETLRHQQSTLPRNSPEAHLHQTSRRGSSEVWRRQSWQFGQEHVWNSRRFTHLAT